MRTRIVVLLFVSFLTFSCVDYVKVIESKTRVAFIEKFDNDSNKWEQVHNREFLVENTNGLLHIEKFKKNRISNGCLWYRKAFESLNTRNDFEISFDAKYISYDDIYNALDIQWGNMDSVSYQLTVCPDGDFRFNKFDKFATSRWTYISKIVIPGLIKKNDFNRIQIIQLNRKCIILVNKKIVFKENVDCEGNQIGFQECLRVAWGFDNFIIRSPITR
ncbi:MAG: hypothetical protein PHT07_01170 [Paludibacter sp.]|nr:hypothetical protein [Paludibacter sp.]